MSSHTNPHQKLLLLQGISLIHDGIQFIEWAENMPNELSYDLFSILTDRFHLFRESVLNGAADHLIIDRVKSRLQDVRYGHERNQKVQAALKALRKLVVSRQPRNKKYRK